MPHSAQTVNLNGPAIAATLDELLARHDQSFIYCAYQTLLGRDPDEEGLNYYLGRLRSGIPKIQILGQLRRSKEGKDYAADLLRLDAAIRRYCWANKVIIGWLVRLFVRVEGNNLTERELRGLERQLFRLGEENHRRFDQMEKALSGLHHLVADQIEQIKAVMAVEGSTAQVQQEGRMRRKTKDTDMTHRDFLKTAGLADLAVAGAGVIGAVAKRQLGKTGNRVGIDGTVTAAFIFDDAFISLHENKSVFTSRRIPISVAVPSALMGTKDPDWSHMSWEQLRELVDEYGWVICNHGNTHKSFGKMTFKSNTSKGIKIYTFEGMTLEETRAEIHEGHRGLLERGLAVEPYYVYAYGHMGSHEQRALVAELYPYAFGVENPSGSLLTDCTKYTRHTIPRFPIDMKTPLEDITGAIDASFSAGGPGIVFYAHRIVNGDFGDEELCTISTGKLSKILDYLEAHNVSVVLPMEILINLE